MNAKSSIEFLRLFEYLLLTGASFFPLSVRVCGCKWLSSAGHVLSQWTLIDLLYVPTIAPQARRLDRLPAIVAHEGLLPENLGQAFDRPFAHTQNKTKFPNS